MSIPKLDQALTDFRNTLDTDVKSLISLHERDSGSAGRPPEWLKTVRRAATVLLAANLENYIETAVCAGLEHLSGKDVPARKFPETYRLWNFRQDIHMRSLSVEDVRKVAEISMKLWSDVRELKPTELKLEQLKEEFANPTPKNVNFIMSLWGFTDYVDGIELEVLGKDTAAKAALGELAKRRNDIAHGDVSQNPAIDDIKRLTKFSQLFANKIAKDLSKAVEKCLR